MNQTKPVKIEIPRTLIGAKMEQLIAIGFRIVPDLRSVPGEGTYCVAEAPEGWSLRPGQAHSNEHYLHDEFGRRRAVMFHQMNFSSRIADRRLMTWERRFGINPRAYAGSMKKRAVAITDTGVEIHRVGTYRIDCDDHRAMSRLEGEARAWLAQRYPHHTDAMAHWEAPVPAVAEAAAAGHEA